MAEQNTLVIAIRKSALAMWQAEHIKARLEALHPGLQVRLLGMTSKGTGYWMFRLQKWAGRVIRQRAGAGFAGQEADIAVHP